jgi:hypothetical protein
MINPKPKTFKQIAVAGNILGVDELLMLQAMSHSPKKIQPMKAIFGKKHIKFKHPPLKWETKYQKVKI